MSASGNNHTKRQNHPDDAASFAQGRYPEAEPLYKRALAIREKA